MAQSPDLKAPLEACRSGVSFTDESLVGMRLHRLQNEAALFHDPASNDHCSAAVRVDGRLCRSHQNACSDSW